jgi:hypothetical protein
VAVYELPLLPNNTAVKHFYTNRSVAKCCLDIYRWGAGLVVSGRIRDIGHTDLQASFEARSSSIPSCLHGFLPRFFTKPLLEIKFYHALIM